MALTNMYYLVLTSIDLQYEEKYLHDVVWYEERSIVEWNLDGLSECWILKLNVHKDFELAKP